MKCKNCGKDITNIYPFTQKPYCSKSCETKNEGTPKNKEMADLLQVLSEMPDEEVKYVNMSNPQFTIADVTLYKRCKDKGDFTGWEKLKKIRNNFSN